jgi:hypothetical protein
MKYAIAKIIRPISILEIGFRYGYSAITFLKASENATYLGIDNGSDTFGENKGAGSWAKQITKDYNAEFLLANSQSMILGKSRLSRRDFLNKRGWEYNETQ